MRPFSKATEETMFCFVSFLYWTENKKFDDNAWQCSAFTPSVQFKPKFKCWQHLAGCWQDSTKAFLILRTEIKLRLRTFSQPFQRTFANSYSLLSSANLNFSTEVTLSSVATAIPHNKRGEEIDLLSHPFFLQINGSQSLFHYNACSLSSTLAETYINHGHWTGINEGNWIQCVVLCWMLKC